MLQKNFLVFALVAALVMAGTIIVYAQAPQGQQGARGGQGGGRGGQAAAPAIKEIKPGLHMVTGLGGNSTVRVTNDGIFLVDTKNLGEANYTQLVNLIKTVSTQPIRFVAVTHVHQDHSGNIEHAIKGGAQVIAHENLVKNLETYNPQQGKPATPNAPYSGNQRNVMLGNVQVQVRHFGAGHTSGDSYVYFPDLRVIATGDAFANNMNCDYAQGGSILSWAKALEEVLKLDFDTAIPGHGNDPMTKAQVQAAQQRFAKISATAIDLVKKGTTKENLVAAIAAADSTLNVAGLLQNNNPVRLDGFYAEVQAAAR
jgi:glyoxylase-like metal-dependent hydrolase (beta-lactamase superfamily II)